MYLISQYADLLIVLGALFIVVSFLIAFGLCQSARAGDEINARAQEEEAQRRLRPRRDIEVSPVLPPEFHEQTIALSRAATTKWENN